MRLSHERCVHLSHLVINLFEDDDRVEFLQDTNDVRLKILQIRKRILSQKRDIPEGSAEWDILFRKYYEDEMKKVRRVRE
jgi:hypothetical protein